MEYKDITFKAVDIRVGYLFEKGDNGVWRDEDGGGYPATPDLVELYELTIKGVDVFELLEPHHTEIEEQILNER